MYEVVVKESMVNIDRNTWVHIAVIFFQTEHVEATNNWSIQISSFSFFPGVFRCDRRQWLSERYCSGWAEYPGRSLHRK